MNNSRSWLFIKILTVCIFIFLGFFLDSVLDSREPVSPHQISTQGKTVTLLIDGLYDGASLPALETETALSLLQRLNAQDSNLQLATKDYPGLGSLVESMNGMINGTDDKYWQYTVNNIMPQVGASAYQLKDGDIIEWRFEKSEF